MPTTEQCVLGHENRTRIDNLEKAIDRIEAAVNKIANHYSKKPSWFITILITVLSNAIVLLSAYIITH